MTRRKTKTVKIKGSIDYAKVPDRVLEFRRDHPRGLIETEPKIQEDGQLMFKCRIVRDKSDPNSGEAVGHSLGKNTGEKAFEKLETIAVGRALAFLGYCADGEIASSEEMEEFLKEKEEREKTVIDETIEMLQSANTLDDLSQKWKSITSFELKKKVEHVKEEMKKKLSVKNAEPAPPQDTEAPPLPYDENDQF